MLAIHNSLNSSVDLSAPFILPPWVWLPITPSTLFSIYKVQIVYLSLELECEKNENKQKEAGMANFKNNSLTLDYSIKISLLRLYLLYVVNHLCKTLTVTDAKSFLVNNDKLLQKQKSCQSKTPEKTSQGSKTRKFVLTTFST